MSRISTVAYGWGALCVASGVAYYYAKKSMDQKRRDTPLRASRMSGSKSLSDRTSQSDKTPGDSPYKTSSPGVRADPSMQSDATGVSGITGASAVKEQ
ncbi:hypothetical protein BCR39DRAFT_518180 [Naematelia encephala]|uniref:Uncharacterized protein n=1 Tax=Naematelia encephala TaxID=71784 RepID=A0A1Y2BHG1_9TREE|nr:hypothetical protein BCR39DRAFT_518180 [Naematelia encephala]